MCCLQCNQPCPLLQTFPRILCCMWPSPSISYLCPLASVIHCPSLDSFAYSDCCPYPYLTNPPPDPGFTPSLPTPPPPNMWTCCSSMAGHLQRFVSLLPAFPLTLSASFASWPRSSWPAPFMPQTQKAVIAIIAAIAVIAVKLFHCLSSDCAP